MHELTLQEKKIKINNSKQLKDLQKEFNEGFPYLKIEFFSKPHEAGNGSNEADILATELTIGEVRDNDVDRFFCIHLFLKFTFHYENRAQILKRRTHSANTCTLCFLYYFNGWRNNV